MPSRDPILPLQRLEAEFAKTLPEWRIPFGNEFGSGGDKFCNNR
jgi:hypothetical protein